MLLLSTLGPGSCTADFRFESVLETESVLEKKFLAPACLRKFFFPKHFQSPKHFQTESQLYMIRAIVYMRQYSRSRLNHILLIKLDDDVVILIYYLYAYATFGVIKNLLCMKFLNDSIAFSYYYLIITKCKFKSSSM